MRLNSTGSSWTSLSNIRAHPCSRSLRRSLLLTPTRCLRRDPHFPPPEVPAPAVSSKGSVLSTRDSAAGTPSPVAPGTSVRPRQRSTRLPRSAAQVSLPRPRGQRRRELPISLCIYLAPPKRGPTSLLSIYINHCQSVRQQAHREATGTPQHTTDMRQHQHIHPCPCHVHLHSLTHNMYTHTHSRTTQNVDLSVDNVTRSTCASPAAKPSSPARPALRPRPRPRRRAL